MEKEIYIVDDEENILEILEYNLKKNDYKVKSFRDGKSFMEYFNRKKPDLVVLDLMLPDLDGFDICREIKKKTNIPVIILSAKSEEFDKVLGLELGADDYIVKPFGVREFMARVKNVLKRTADQSSEGADKAFNGKFAFNEIELSIDENKHEILLDNNRIDLNPKEFQIVSLLLRNINSLISRIELIKRVWGDDYFGDTRTLDVHVRRIREKKSYKDFGKKFIKTVHGYGYKMTVNI